MSKVLITGGSGFIGCNLVAYLLKMNYEVLNLDLVSPRNVDLKKSWEKCNLLEQSSLEASAKRFNPAYVIHLAARTDLKGSSIDDYKANTEGTRNLIKVLENLEDVSRVIFASSRLVCKIGHTPIAEDDYSATTSYGLSKVMMEKDIRRLCRDAAYDWLIFRPTSIWGPWFGEPYRDFFDVVASGKYFHPLGIKITKSFGYVGNAVYLLEKVISSTASLQKNTIYLTDFVNIDVLDWANLIRKKMGKSNVRQVPLIFLRGVASFGSCIEWVGFKRVPLTKFRLDNLLTDMYFDTSSLLQFDSELPFPVDVGVDETLEWIREQKV